MPPRRTERPSQDERPANPNPRAAALADAFGAPYQEVVRFFERGYPPAEIERAYRLGKETDTEASDILAMRDAGMDWREVQKALVTVNDFVEDAADDEEEDARPSVRRKAAARRRQPDGRGPKRRR